VHRRVVFNVRHLLKEVSAFKSGAAMNALRDRS